MKDHFLCTDVTETFCEEAWSICGVPSSNLVGVLGLKSL